MMEKLLKKVKNNQCNHSHIENNEIYLNGKIKRHELYKDGIIEIQELRCCDCGKTWRYNTLLNYWSDSFIGVFKKNDN